MSILKFIILFNLKQAYQLVIVHQLVDQKNVMPHYPMKKHTVRREMKFTFPIRTLVKYLH